MSVELPRRAILAGAALSIVARPALAAFPDRPLRMVVGFGPGGTVDTMARLVGDGMTRSLGQPVVVENRPGASNTLAAENVVRAPADGTSMLAGVFSHAVAPALVRLNFDMLTDFVGVTQLVRTPVFLFAAPNAPFSTVPELVAAAKAAPGTITFASGGVGSSAHLAPELLQRRAGISLTHVPYRGGGEAFSSLLAGTVTLLCDTPQSSTRALLDEGKMKALCVMTPQRLPRYPEIPTIAEVGLGEGLEVQAWQGVLVRSGTPRESIDILYHAIRDALATPEAQARMANLGVEPAVNGPDAYTDFFRSEVRRWSQVAREIGLTAQ